jgi:hypothetical protein
MMRASFHMEREVVKAADFIYIQPEICSFRNFGQAFPSDFPSRSKAIAEVIGHIVNPN